MKITGFIAISFSIVCSTAACSDDPVAVANPEPAVTVVKVPNGSFEEDAAETASPKGWTVSGTILPRKWYKGDVKAIMLYSMEQPRRIRYLPVRLSTVWKMVFMTLNFIIKVPEDKYPVMWQPGLILRK
mgnify:FL=1